MNKRQFDAIVEAIGSMVVEIRAAMYNVRTQMNEQQRAKEIILKEMDARDQVIKQQLNCVVRNGELIREALEAAIAFRKPRPYRKSQIKGKAKK